MKAPLPLRASEAFCIAAWLARAGHDSVSAGFLKRPLAGRACDGAAEYWILPGLSEI